MLLYIENVVFDQANISHSCSIPNSLVKIELVNNNLLHRVIPKSKK